NLPLFRRHQAAGFLGQVDAGLLAEPEFGGVFGHAGNTKAVSQSVEKHVAGLVNALTDINRAVPVMQSGNPALEISAVESCPARAVYVQILGDAFLQSRSRHDDFEGRARSKLGLDGFVHEGMLIVSGEFDPLIPGNPYREVIRIEGGP